MGVKRKRCLCLAAPEKIGHIILTSVNIYLLEAANVIEEDDPFFFPPCGAGESKPGSCAC